jgi:hypothetical protein
MIDPLSPDNLTIDEAAALCPGRPHRHTVYRWHLYGIRGKRLDAKKINGRLYTSRDALEAFLDAIQTSRDTFIVTAPDTETKSKQRAARARKRLEKAGI